MTAMEIIQTAQPLPHIAENVDLMPHDQNPYVVYLARLGSLESQRTMRGCLDRIAWIATGGTGNQPPQGVGLRFTWHLLRHQHTAALRARMHEQTTERDSGPPTAWSPSTINKHLAALRCVLKQAWKLELMTTDDYMRAVAVDSAKGKREPMGRSINEKEFAAMLAACADDESPAGRRDAAVIALLHSTGLRRAEVANARRSEYDAGRGSLRVIGKGNKQRTVFVHASAANYLTAWLRTSENVRGPLICPIDRWGNATDRTMTPKAVADLVNRRRLQAGLPPLTPHDFRRTFAGDLLDNGADLVQVKELLGHTSADVTAGYDRRPERQRQAAVNRLHLPEPKRFRDDQPLPHEGAEPQ